MKVYLASADPAEIEWGSGAGIIDGIVTTPTMLASDGAQDDERTRLSDICRATSLPVCATVAALSEDDIYQTGRELSRIADNIIVQVPMVEDAITAAHRLATGGVRVGAFLVFTAAQALLAAKLGACMITTAPDAIAEFGLEGQASLGGMAAALRSYPFACDLFVAAPRNAADVLACANARADGIVVDAATLRRLLVHPLTDRGLDFLLHELSKTHRVRVST